jgi:type II secretory pathway pseudopilin PulG
MNSHESRHGEQKGFTLIEALVVMIVGIVILAAAAAGIGKLFRSSEITEEVSNITQMQSQLTSLSRSDRNTYIQAEDAIRFKVIPANMTVKNNRIFNAWGGPVLVSAWQGLPHVDYLDVPADACSQLVLKLRDTGWRYVYINQQRVTTTSTLKDIGGYCQAGGDRNFLAFQMEDVQS